MAERSRGYAKGQVEVQDHGIGGNSPKHCQICDRWLPRTAEHWGVNPAAADGLASRCKRCRCRDDPRKQHCVVCGDPLRGHDPERSTCGRPQCVAALTAFVRAEIEADVRDQLAERCAVCGAPTRTTHDDLGRTLDVCEHGHARLVPRRRGERANLPHGDPATAPCVGLPLFAPKVAA